MDAGGVWGAVFVAGSCLLVGCSRRVSVGSVDVGRAAPEARAIVGELVACGTRHSLSSWTDPRRGIGCGRDAVVRRMEAIAARSGGRMRIVVDRFEATAPRTRGEAAHFENVYAVVDGADGARKSVAFVISGHLDSMPSDVMDAATDAPGADDDASGVAVSILAAEAVAQAPHRGTIVLAAVSGEEQGLLGAKRMVLWLAEQGYAVGGMATNDIVGASNGADDRRPRLFSEGGVDGVDPPSRELARSIEELATPAAVRLVLRRDRLSRGGDHLPFLEAGAPAVRFTEPREDYRHQHQTPRVEGGVTFGDRPEHLDFVLIARTAAVNAAFLSELADAPAPPRSVKLTGAVSPAAHVTIDAEDDAERAGFEVLTRDTLEPRWRLAHAVSPDTDVVLPGAPPDDAYFAVRSVGRNGRRSIAVPAVAPPRAKPGDTK